MGVWRIALPKTISPLTAAALRRDLRTAVKDGDCSALVLAGEGESFCEGMDFASLDRPAVARGAVEAFAACLQTLRNSPKPTIALVDGRALGGGVGLAVACDGVIATERSVFALPEVLFGLLPAVIAPFLLERMAPRRFELWALTGEGRSAEAARADGLVDEIVPAAELEAAARHWLRKLSRPRPATVKGLKALVGGATGREALLKKGVLLTTRALADKKLRAALRAYADGGIPPWEAS